MTISNNVADHITEVDILIAGGGTAACVLAGRLAKLDPSLSILLVEGGKNNHNDLTVNCPALFLKHLAPDSKTAIFYKGNKSDALAGREPIVPTGGILGGGSSINFMMYTRAQGVDFDSFKTEGWTQQDLLPLLKKLETFHSDDPIIDRNLHGYDGPIHVSSGTHRATRAEREFLEVASTQGWPEIVDLQDLQQNNGFSSWQRYVSPDGKRQDSAHRYIHDLLEHGDYPNLHVLTETLVSRVIFDAKRAVGLEVEPNMVHRPLTGLSKHPRTRITARKTVVIAAGALGTPQILERSGVGEENHLKSLGIPVVADLPGVGANYQDHHLTLLPYKTSLAPDETIDELLSGRLDLEAAVKEKNPILGWNSIDISSKLRPRDDEVAALGPEFQAAWDRDFKDSPSRPLMLMGIVSAFLGDPGSVPAGQYSTVGCYTGYPYSRGSIHISGESVYDPPSFETGFLSDKDDLDLKAQVWAYKRQREICRRLSTYRGELQIGHPKFSTGSAAALVSFEEGAQPENRSMEDRCKMSNIEYSAEDDKAIAQYVRENLNTTWHSLGTCAMRPLQGGGVVDKDLNVYGLEGLKLCDLSIIPENVGANTNNTALLVGEKAAAILAAELGLTDGEGAKGNRTTQL
ncbi:hypothetical protein VE04_05939 [Pseudogymnoascus sp. 24MN13]|nr:hypothetical protein VE04_05939 [Pseudogymnoascus sp. 24MN13]